MTARESYAVVWNRVTEDTSLSRDARLLFTILDGLPPDGDGWKLATYPQLAAKLGVSLSTAQRRIRELGKAGLIDWERGGTGRPNRYLLLDIVPRSGQRGGGVLQVAAEPQSEALHFDGVGGAELAQEPRIGTAPAAPDGTGRVTGRPDALHCAGGVHEPDLLTVSGVSRNEAAS